MRSPDQPVSPVIQCVPNFSEGRRPEVIAAIVEAVGRTPGVRIADWSADRDHHRMVVTCVGGPAEIREAALAAADAAVMQIDLRMHDGVHPRLGALDVMPLVPIAGVTLEECAEWAVQIGREISERHRLPVFLYEAASPTGVSLPVVRKQAFKTLRPSFGPAVPHPGAGAAVIGARMPLIAYNVNLTTHDLTAAQTIARELREGGGAGFAGVRALGLSLESQGIAQVSMNITRPAETPLLAVHRYVERRALELGSGVSGGELIGALPGYTAFGVLGDALGIKKLLPGQVLLENWPDQTPPHP